MRLEASDYPDLATAIADAREGDSLHVPGLPDVPGIPGQDFYKAPEGGWKITRSIELYGDGAGHFVGRGGTAFVPYGLNEDVFVIEPPSPSGEIRSVYLHDFSIRSGMLDGKNGEHGIRCVTGANRRIRSLRMEGILALNLNGDCFHLEAVNGTDGYIGSVAITACTGTACDGIGLLLKNVLESRALSCALSANALGGIRCTASGAALYGPALEANSADPAATQGQMLLEDCHTAIVDAAHIERFNPTDNQGLQTTACVLDGCKGAALVAGNVMGQPAGADETTGISLSPTCKAVVLLPNSFGRVHPNIVVVHAAAVDCAVLPQFNDRGFDAPLGVVSLPGEPNEGLTAVPIVIRVGPPGADLTGFIIPSLSAAPTGVIRDGMLYYDTTLDRLRVRVNGAWKSVVTT